MKKHNHNHNHNPTGRRTPLTPQEFPLAWHVAVTQLPGTERAIACEENEGAARAVAARFRRFLASASRTPGTAAYRAVTSQETRIVVSIRRSLMGWFVIVSVEAMPDIAQQLGKALSAEG